jgi:hypothetical protein
MHDIESLFSWDLRLGKDHGQTFSMSLELGLMLCLE